jgi:hypothetical protein
MADETKPKCTLSPEARQRIIGAQKKRWADIKAGKKAVEKKPKKRGPSVAPKSIKAGKKTKKRAKAPLSPKNFAEGLGGAFVAALKPVNTEQTPEATIKDLQAHVDRIDSDLDKAENAVDDLRAILEREYQYHSLRAEELERELERYDVEID